MSVQAEEPSAPDVEIINQITAEHASTQQYELLNALKVLRKYTEERNCQDIMDQFEQVILSGRESLSLELATMITQRRLENAREAGLLPGEIEKFSTHTEKLANDCKRIFDKHVTYVVRQAREEMKENRYRKIGAILSFTGKAWDGLSEFWDEFVSEHKTLLLADKPIKVFSIALYVIGLPVIGIIKAAEFVGRSLTEYGKSKKLFASIYKAAKQTGASIAKHFLRLSIGQAANPSIKSFYEKLGLHEENVKELLRIVNQPEQMEFLSKLSPELASRAAVKITDILEKKLGIEVEIDVTKTASAIISSLLNNLEESKAEDLVRLLHDGINSRYLNELPPEAQPVAIEKITKVLKENPSKDIAQIVTKGLHSLSSEKIIIDMEDFESSIKQQNPKLHKKLKKFFAISKGRSLNDEELSNMLVDIKDLRKLKASTKTELKKLATNYGVQKVLERSIGLAPEEVRKERRSFVDKHPPKAKRRARFFMRRNPKSKVKALEESRSKNQAIIRETKL